MAVGQIPSPQSDSMSFQDHLGKRDFTNFDATGGYLYDEDRDEADLADLRKPGRKKDPNEPETKRRAQNRAAQRAFRERKERHLKDLETRVHELEQSARSWQNSNLMLRTKLSALEDELEQYRSGRVSSGAMTSTASLGMPVDPLAMPAAPAPHPSTLPVSQFPADFLGDLHGPASILPARSASITGLHGPATILSSALPQSTLDAQFFDSVLSSGMPSSAPSAIGSLSSSSTPRSVPSEFVSGSLNSAPPLVEAANSTSSSASSEQSPWEGSRFCEQLQKAACPLPKLPLADAAPQIVPLTNDWERRPSALSFSFGYREPSAEPNDLQPNFADLLSNDYGYFDPLDDPLKSMDSLNTLSAPSLGDGLGMNLGIGSDLGLSGEPPAFHDPGLYPVDVPPSVVGMDGFVKEEMPSPAGGAVYNPPQPKSADEVPAKTKKYMSCQAVWDRICSHPNFEGINLDELCSEFQAKARCSDSGVVLTEEDVDVVLRQAPRRQVLS